MPVLSQRLQISQLSQGDHTDQIFLSVWLINTIGPDPICGPLCMTTSSPDRQRRLRSRRRRLPKGEKMRRSSASRRRHSSSGYMIVPHGHLEEDGQTQTENNMDAKTDESAGKCPVIHGRTN